jgi:hypothetical protein
MTSNHHLLRNAGSLPFGSLFLCSLHNTQTQPSLLPSLPPFLPPSLPTLRSAGSLPSGSLFLCLLQSASHFVVG